MSPASGRSVFELSVCGRPGGFRQAGRRKKQKTKNKGGPGPQASESVPVEKIGKNFFFLFMRGYLTALSLSALRGRREASVPRVCGPAASRVTTAAAASSPACVLGAFSWRDSVLGALDSSSEATCVDYLSSRDTSMRRPKSEVLRTQKLVHESRLRRIQMYRLPHMSCPEHPRHSPSMRIT